MGTTLNLKPEAVFRYFEEISQIPRGSGNEKAVSDYLVNFAKENELEAIQDSAMNVIIKKPAAKGYENAPAVILQGHMDMVCEKNKDKVHDFEKDPITLRVDGDMLYADGTTLGADNGIAVAFALSVLADKAAEHPALEVLITTEEETGMGGALAVNPENLKGKYLINIDSEVEGEFLVSCSGGVRVVEKLNIEWIEAKKDAKTFHLTIRGLKGGHSGMEINKERGNSNKLMGRILDDLYAQSKFNLRELNGGAKMNAIPREADVIFDICGDFAKELPAFVEKWNGILQNELRAADPDVCVAIDTLAANTAKVFSDDTTEKAIASLVLIPNGVQSMSMDLDGLVESSTNLGVVTTTAEDIRFESAIRSCVKTIKEKILKQSAMAAKIVGASFEATNDYPEWQYNPDSDLRPIFIETFKKIYNKEPHINAIHAGLECGLFKEKMPHLDMISLGPDTFDVHTPNEHVSISSTERVYDFLVQVLKDMK